WVADQSANRRPGIPRLQDANQRPATRSPEPLACVRGGRDLAESLAGDVLDGVRRRGDGDVVDVGGEHEVMAVGARDVAGETLSGDHRVAVERVLRVERAGL